MIKIGLEATRRELKREILSHPSRYFLIRAFEGRAALCMRTCNGCGEDLQDHIIDGLVLMPGGKLISIFEDDLAEAALMELSEPLDGGDLLKYYLLSPALIDKISRLEEMIDWIISSVLVNGRHLLICQSWLFGTCSEQKVKSDVSN